jgi:cell division protein FtsZ
MNDQAVKTGPSVAVVGVGHGGTAAVMRLSADWPDSPNVFAIGTDQEMLERSLIPPTHRVQIGEATARGMSTGGNVELGREAAESDRDRLQGVFAGVKMAFLVGGLGGGLATGALPVLARLAREFGVMTVCVVTLPFEFEGDSRRVRAEEGLAELQKAADVVIAVPNQKLFAMIGAGMRIADAFAKADAVLSRALYSVWRMISRPGLISLDYADLHALLSRSGGLGVFGYGDGSGPDKAAEAVRELMANPLLDGGRLLGECESLLVNIAGGPDLTLLEIEAVMAPIRDVLRKDAHLAMGAIVDEAWRDRLTVTVLAAEKWRQDVSGQMQFQLDAQRQREEAQGAEPELDAAPSRKLRAAREQTGQGDLSLDSGSRARGRFKDVEPTIMDGQNVDIPTFLRRNMAL